MINISTDRMRSMEAVRRISEKLADHGRALITIDGPCASGKTTLARKLAVVFSAAVIHTDDFVIPHAQKTEERLSIPGGNCDAERLVREVLVPWERHAPIQYREYDCFQDCLRPWKPLPDCDVLIVEGSYSTLPDIRKHADLCLFMETPEAVRMNRLRERESPESLQRFYEKWIPLENLYFKAYQLPDQDCLII